MATTLSRTLTSASNALLTLDLGLDVVDGVGGLNFECDGLASKSLDEDLYTFTEAEDGGLLLDVVVGQGATILKLLAGESQALLVWRSGRLGCAWLRM